MVKRAKINILVIGGAGYLGAVLVPELLKHDYRVTVLDNFMFGQNSLLDCCASANFNVVRADARETGVLKPLLKDADYIIPLAALVGAPLCDKAPDVAVTTNRDAIALLARLAAKQQRIIFPTTNSGYGIAKKGVLCTESSPLNPVSLYARTKVEAEQIVMKRGNAVSFRLATVFGMSARMRVDLLVNNLVFLAVRQKRAEIFEGHFKRNFIHIRDVAAAFIYALENFERMKDEVYNVGLSEANLSKLELCARIKEEVPDFVYLESAAGQDPDKRDYIVSNAKIEKAGFKPVYSLHDGIRELIKGYQILGEGKFSNV